MLCTHLSDNLIPRIRITFFQKCDDDDDDDDDDNDSGETWSGSQV